MGFEKVGLPTWAIEKSDKETSEIQPFDFLATFKHVGYYCVSCYRNKQIVKE